MYLNHVASKTLMIELIGVDFIVFQSKFSPKKKKNTIKLNSHISK